MSPRCASDHATIAPMNEATQVMDRVHEIEAASADTGHDRPAGPHIVVFGAGSIGCWLGGRLTGHAPVSMIGRAHMASVIARHGLQMTAFDGWRRKLRPEQVAFATHAQAAAGADLVLLTVKSAATAQAAGELAPHLRPGTPVVSFQNGLRNAQVLAAGLPSCMALAGMVPYNVVQTGPGRIHQASSGQLMVQAHPALEPFVPIFAEAGVPLTRREDMPAVQAGKLLLNFNNAINALADVPLREELSQRDWRRCLALAQAEALAVYRAARIVPARVTPLPSSWLPALMRLPDALFMRLASRLLRIDPLARSSMWDDLAAQRATEVDYIQGEIVELGRAHSVATPVNARLMQRVHEAEQARRHWSASELLADLRAAMESAR